jgi:hypothetical protein
MLTNIGTTVILTGQPNNTAGDPRALSHGRLRR